MFQSNVSYDKLATPYTKINFAILHSRGLGHVFDTLRYDSAFFAKKEEVEKVVEASRNYINGGFASQEFTMVLGKYDWPRALKHSWTPARLLRCQRYEFPDVQPEHRKVGKLKYKSVATVTGQLPDILKVMFKNNALPASERESGVLDTALWTPGEDITVKLVNYLLTDKHQWDFSDLPAQVR